MAAGSPEIMVEWQLAISGGLKPAVWSRFLVIV
jgi:hypothetical protein